MRAVCYYIFSFIALCGFSLTAAEIRPNDRDKTDYETSWSSNSTQTYTVGAVAVGCSFATNATQAGGGATLKTNESDRASSEKSITHTEYPNTSGFSFSVHGILAGSGSGTPPTWSVTLEQKFFWLSPIEKIVAAGTDVIVSANGAPTESTWTVNTVEWKEGGNKKKASSITLGADLWTDMGWNPSPKPAGFDPPTGGEYTITATTTEKTSARSASANICVVDLQFVTPSGDPEKDPSTSNEFVFLNTNPGKLTLNLSVKVVPASAIDKIKDNAIFTVDTIGNSTMAWHQDNPGGKATVSGDTLIATVTFTNLPSSNSAFGKKTAKITCTGSFGTIEKSTDYEVFFPKNATNHPSNASNSNWPNWMFYWLQTITPLGSPTFKYGTSSFFTPGTTEITLSAGDAGSYNAPYGANNPLEGIDNFAWTVIHESQHYKDWLDLWNNNYSYWLNNYSGKTTPGGDKDSDFIPNRTEDVNLNGTYDTGDLYDWQVYNTPTAGRPASIVNDFEDWNCTRHTGVTGNHSKDWGAPGMQHNTKDKYND
jgi:hypothetical protein